MPLSPEFGDVSSFQAKVEFKCPFCESHAAIGEDAEGNGGVLHTVPYCAEFERMNALEYAQSVRYRFSADLAS